MRAMTTLSEIYIYVAAKRKLTLTPSHASQQSFRMCCLIIDHKIILFCPALKKAPQILEGFSKIEFTEWFDQTDTDRLAS